MVRDSYSAPQNMFLAKKTERQFPNIIYAALLYTRSTPVLRVNWGIVRSWPPGVIIRDDIGVEACFHRYPPSNVSGNVLEQIDCPTLVKVCPHRKSVIID